MKSLREDCLRKASFSLSVLQITEGIQVSKWQFSMFCILNRLTAFFVVIILSPRTQERKRHNRYSPFPPPSQNQGKLP